MVKSFFTKLTFEWLSWRMGTFVSVKCRSESKSLSTNVAFVGSVSGMSIDMCLEVSFLIEAFAAVFAFVHSNSGMSSHVVLQVSELFEAAAALATPVWLLTSVSVAMYFHVDFLMESLSAKIARKWFVICVCSHMGV